MRASFRRWIVVLIVLVVLAALLYRSRSAIGLEDFSWTRLADAVRQAQPAFLLLALLAIYVAYALRAARWNRFCCYLGQLSFLRVYRATLIGFTASFLLGRPGEAVRPLLIARKEKLPAASMFGIYVLERLFDLAATALMFGISLLLFPDMLERAQANSGSQTGARVVGLIILVGLAGEAALLLYVRFHAAEVLERRMETWRARGGMRRHVANLFAGLGHGLQAIRTWRDLSAAVGWTIVHWAVIVLIYVWVAHGFGGRLAQLDFAAAMLVVAFTMVGSIFLLPGVGGGPQALTILALTSVFAVETEPATAAAIVIWLVTFAACSLVGVPLLIREGFSVTELERIATEEEKQAEEGAATAPVDRGELPR